MPLSIAKASFTRPADITAYASGDLAANSTTAGSVTAMTFNLGGNYLGGKIKRVRIKKSGTSITTCTLRLHLYGTGSITAANGDNGVWSTDKAAYYLGFVDVVVDKAFTDGAAGVAAFTAGAEITTELPVVYGLLEARSAYTPASAEVFTVELEYIQDLD